MAYWFALILIAVSFVGLTRHLVAFFHLKRSKFEFLPTLPFFLARTEAFMFYLLPSLALEFCGMLWRGNHTWQRALLQSLWATASRQYQNCARESLWWLIPALRPWNRAYRHPCQNVCTREWMFYMGICIDFINWNFHNFLTEFPSETTSLCIFFALFRLIQSYLLNSSWGGIIFDMKFCLKI